MAKYVTQSNIVTLWNGIKTKLRAKVDVVEGKGLSTNDLTNALKANYDAAYTNRVTGVTVNGVEDATKAKFTTVGYEEVLNPSGNPSTKGYFEYSNGAYTLSEDNEVNVEKTYYEATGIRRLDIVMPTKLQDLSNDSTGKYATEAMVTGITGTPTDGKTLVEMIADVGAGNLSTEFVDSVPAANAAVNNTIYMVPATRYKAVVTPTGNPSTSGYYEYDSSTDTYTASSDSSVSSSKRYYVVDEEAGNVYDEYLAGTKTTYEEVSDPEGDPSDQGYFELVSGEYVESEDSSVDGSKTYYEVVSTKVVEKVGSSKIDLTGFLLAGDALSDSEIETLLLDDTSAGATD